jgi:hypothetical protein
VHHEVANVPQKGMSYKILPGVAGDYGDAMKLDRAEYRSHTGIPYLSHRYTRGMVWENVVLKAPDQLRQRMAWALSQIFVVNDKNKGLNHQHEIYNT